MVAIAAGMFFWNDLRNYFPAFSNNPEEENAGDNGVKQGGADGSTTVVAGFPLSLPKGFSMSVYAKGLQGPRVMQFDAEGNLLVSLTESGVIAAIPEKRDGTTGADPVVLAERLNRPHGLALGNLFNRYVLYVAESDQVSVYDYDPGAMKLANKKKIIDLPNGGNHFTRSLLFLPDSPIGKVFVSVGSSCDVCNEEDDARASVLVADADGNNLKKYASGLRNSVFMAVHPITGKIYATEMGRDYLGDEMPPDEVNIIEEGRDYGWPVCFGKNVHDESFDPPNFDLDTGEKIDPCVEPEKTPSFIDLPAHSAPLGLAFLSGNGWPNEFQNNLLVAYHGSWNRTTPTGYKIVRFRLDAEGNYRGEDDFITGWLDEESQVMGRPVAIVAKTDGTIYISDDQAGMIYRLEYKK